MRKIFLFLLGVAALLRVTAQTPAFVTDSLDTYINQGLKDWSTPGLAVVIVKDGNVVLSKGYGVRDIRTKATVNDSTLFMIASNTKLFTGTLLALLETRGLLSLNDKITKYFPDYRLYDSSTTNLVTIRDLLTHRIGTKTFQGDFTFLNSRLSREDIMQRMRLLQPSQTFRQDFGYCNSCFLTAGQVIPKVTGKAWEQWVQDSLLTPLKMTNTYPLSTGIASRPNLATPYTTSFGNTPQAVPYDNWNNLAPAASIVSNVKDLAHWLQFQLDSGRFNGSQVLPFSVLLKTRDLQISTGSRKSSFYPVHFRGYGLGLFMSDYNGRAIYWHTGGADGMVSNVCFVPEEKLGIAILTNNDNQGFFEALRYQILDAYLGVPYVNRSLQQLPNFQTAMHEQMDSIQGWKKRVTGAKPELPLTAYTGKYSNPLYGDITISQAGKGLTIAFNTTPNLTGKLDYMSNGDWLLQYNHAGYGIFSIRFALSGTKVVSVTTKQNEFLEYDPYTFVKK